MGLEKVVEEIKENAKKEAESIVREAKKQADSIISEAEKKIKERGQELEKQNEQTIRQIEMRNLTMRKSRKKELLLNTKKGIMDDVYEKFLERMSRSKGRDKERIYKKLVALARKQIQNPKFVYANPDDVSVLKRLAGGMQVKKKDLKGGFMLESEDGREFVDFRLETLIELLKERTLKDVSKILFGG